MPQIVLDIPAGQSNRVVNAFAISRGFTGLDLQGAVETKIQFLKRKLIADLKAIVKQVEADAAMQAARQTSDASVESGVTIT